MTQSQRQRQAESARAASPTLRDGDRPQRQPPPQQQPPPQPPRYEDDSDEDLYGN